MAILKEVAKPSEALAVRGVRKPQPSRRRSLRQSALKAPSETTLPRPIRQQSRRRRRSGRSTGHRRIASRSALVTTIYFAAAARRRWRAGARREPGGLYTAGVAPESLLAERRPLPLGYPFHCRWPVAPDWQTEGNCSFHLAGILAVAPKPRRFPHLSASNMHPVGCSLCCPAPSLPRRAGIRWNRFRSLAKNDISGGIGPALAAAFGSAAKVLA